MGFMGPSAELYLREMVDLYLSGIPVIVGSFRYIPLEVPMVRRLDPAPSEQVCKGMLSLSLLLCFALACGSKGSSSDSQDPAPSGSNHAPVAQAGDDQQAAVNAAVSLNGSASSDADGDALSYQWQISIAPAGSTSTLQNATSVTATFVPDRAGDYEVQLTVNDWHSGSDTDSIVVHVAASTNQAPAANAGSNQSVTVGGTVSLDGSGSSDADGDALTYQWTLSTVPTGSNARLQNDTTVAASFVPDVAGTYQVQLTVSDGHGGSNSATVQVQAAAAAQPLPAAYAGADQMVTPGESVTLSSTGSNDPVGGTLSCTWSLRSRPQGSSAALGSTTAATSSFTTDVAGIYQVDLVVHAGSRSSLPDTVTITAQPGSLLATPNPSTAAEIVISDQVIQSGVEGVGMNLTHIAGGTNFATNNEFSGTGFEPMVYRKLIRVTRAGTNSTGAWIEWDSDQGPAFWDTLYTGFGNGAECRFYRIVDAANTPLPYADGLTDATGADHVQFLGAATVPMPGGSLPNGGWISEGINDASGNPLTNPVNRVYLDKNLNLRNGDYLFLVLKKLESPVEHMHPRVRQYFNGNVNSVWDQSTVTRTLVPHPGTIPSEFTRHGESCLCLEKTDTDVARLGQYIFHPYDNGEGQWYSQLHPGASYRFSVWMRQDGLGDSGHVRALFTGGPYESIYQETPWSVTDQWQEFNYDFTAPAYPTTGAHSSPGLEWTGPGKLYVDNLILYRNDAAHDFEPYSPADLSLSTWKACTPATGKKPAVRFYPLCYGTSAVENLLGMGDSNPSYSVNDGSFSNSGTLTLKDCLEWALWTGTTPQDRVVPFLTVTEKYTEGEWKAIAEYLGVPYDPSTDTPAAHPWAYLRYQQRGTGTPWTDEFREVLLEFGNETWHNGAGGYGWDGFSESGAVHQGGTEYGIFAAYMFKQNVMTMPEWSQYNIGSKLKLALGANYSAGLSEWGDSYAEAAVQRFHEASYLGHANYVGPKWETNDTGSATFDAHGLQETLVGMTTGMSQLIRDAAAVRRLLNGTYGTNYKVEAYEGGPSGYWTNQAHPEIDEYYGKSLAMGVAALDAWLYSSLNGYVHQCYLGFSSGDWWSSHTMPEAGGFRAHAGWLALQMRNRYALGDQMLGVTFNQVPTYNRALTTGGTTPEILPLVTSYALKDSNAYYVFVLSRKYPGTHDGQDFGTGYTMVNLHLPFTWTPSKITLHKLAKPDRSAADPSENNIDSEKIAIIDQDVPVGAMSGQTLSINAQTGGSAAGMPPGTVYLYVFEK
jgi:hypothetical protein